MPITMHSASVPVFVRMLGNLATWFDKAEAHATAKKFDPQVYLAARLAPDMLPLTKQVQIACDSAKFGVARLAGVDAPKFDDTEASFAELRERIHKTLDYINAVPPERLDGTESKEITFPAGRDTTRTLAGEAYLKHLMLPNMFFHITMAYAILRHNGVDLGKKDFLIGAAS